MSNSLPCQGGNLPIVTMTCLSFPVSSFSLTEILRSYFHCHKIQAYTSHYSSVWEFWHLVVSPFFFFFKHSRIISSAVSINELHRTGRFLKTLSNSLTESATEHSFLCVCICPFSFCSSGWFVKKYVCWRQKKKSIFPTKLSWRF